MLMFQTGSVVVGNHYQTFKLMGKCFVSLKNRTALYVPQHLRENEQLINQCVSDMFYYAVFQAATLLKLFSCLSKAVGRKIDSVSRTESSSLLTQLSKTGCIVVPSSEGLCVYGDDAFI